MPLLLNVFSQLKAFALIVLQVYTSKVNLYLAMNCYLFDVQINFCYTYENSQFDLVEFGPLNMIDPHILSRISRTLQGISLQDVPKNWWTEFSTWRDFQALIRTGNLLSVHRRYPRYVARLQGENKKKAPEKIKGNISFQHCSTSC